MPTSEYKRRETKMVGKRAHGKAKQLDSKVYAKLVGRARPHVIHNDDDLEHFTEELLRLDELEKASPEEEELAELLTTLIERYEDEHYAIGDASPVQVIRFLMEQRRLRPKDLVPVIGSKSHTSEILNGKRPISKTMALTLARFFHVAPELFIDWGSGNQPQRRKVHERATPPPQVARRDTANASKIRV